MLRLVGTWQVAAVSGADVPTDSAHAPWLTFEGDGQVYGMSGVNRVRGTFSVKGDTVTFGPLASTMMAGPEDAMRLESSLLRALGQPLALVASGHVTTTSVPASPVADLSDRSSGSPEREDATPLGRLTLVAPDEGRVELVRAIAPA